jgi:hypothetical protein
MAKPSDPNEFIVQELSKIQALMQRGQPVTLFTEKDIQTMFGFFDITGKGTVSQEQYFKGVLFFLRHICLVSVVLICCCFIMCVALNACGIEYPDLPLPTDDKIDKKTFVKHVLAEVMNKAL